MISWIKSLFKKKEPECKVCNDDCFNYRTKIVDCGIMDTDSNKLKNCPKFQKTLKELEEWGKNHFTRNQND